MRRSVLLLTTILLSVATAAVLTLSAATVTLPRATAVVPATGSRMADKTVRRFYDAVNETMATGDVQPVAMTLAPDFIDHETEPGAPAGRERFLARLSGLRAAFPEMRLTVGAMSADGYHVVVHVRVKGADSGEVAGAPLRAPGGAWSGIDRFRLAGGLVAERWAAPARSTLVEHLAAGNVTLQVASQRPFGLERLVFEPGDELPHPSDGDPLLLLVLSGTLTVHLNVASRETVLVTPGGSGSQLSEPPVRTIEPGQVGTVAAGEQLLLSGDRWHPLVMRNDGLIPAEAFSIALSMPARAVGGKSGSGAPDPVVAKTPMVSLLAGGRLDPMPQGESNIRIARAVLAPGASLLPVAESGQTIVVVQSGKLLVATDLALAWITDAPTAKPYHAGTAVLWAGRRHPWLTRPRRIDQHRRGVRRGAHRHDRAGSRQLFFLIFDQFAAGAPKFVQCMESFLLSGVGAARPGSIQA